MDSVEMWVRRCAAQMDEAGLFFGHGTDNALDEAAWLVLHVIGAPLDGGFSAWGAGVSVEDAVAIEALLAQRIQSRKPLAYLLGEAWFCGLLFKTGPGALVPRSPLAELITAQFEPWVPAKETLRVLDLCTGSGCIAIAVAHRIPGSTVDASDISPEALDIAAENVRMHALEARVQLTESDLFEALDGGPYDVIVSNPPYVPERALEALPDEYRAEPALGLISGEDGLDIPLKIMLQAPDHLTEDGVLFCEVGESDERLQNALAGVPLTWLEFSHGGSGVFTIDREQLVAARQEILAALEQR